MLAHLTEGTSDKPNRRRVTSTPNTTTCSADPIAKIIKNILKGSSIILVASLNSTASSDRIKERHASRLKINKPIRRTKISLVIVRNFRPYREQGLPQYDHQRAK